MQETFAPALPRPVRRGTHTLKAISDALGVARSNLVRASGAQAGPNVTETKALIAGQPTYG